MDIAAIISSIGVIVVAWFAYNQKTKDKLIDQKIDKWKKEEEEKSAVRSEAFALIYGELWDLLHTLQACRVYIVQPHPLDDSKYLSVALEGDRKGVSRMRDDIKKLPMEDVAVFARQLVKDDFIFHKSVVEIEDKKTRGILASKGTHAAFIKQLTDGKRWVGNIVCEFTRKCQVDAKHAEIMLREKASTIGYILPEYK